jgi:hypothetical protein
MYDMKPKSNIIFSLICLSFFTAFRIVDDVIENLGLQHQYAQRIILNNIIGRQYHAPKEVSGDDGSKPDSEYNQTKAFTIPRAKMLSAVVQGDKVGATKELCQYIKAYVHSEKFLTDYEAVRKSAMPTDEPPPLDPAVYEQMKQSVKQQEIEIAKLKGNKQIPVATLRQAEEAIADQKKMLAQGNDPTPNKTRWTKMYPENPAALVKTRLEEYVKLVPTVDFNAALATNARRKTFVNPVYEKMSLKWKAVYRAGKDVNATASVFAKEWLQQGIKPGSVQSVPTDYTDQKPTTVSKTESTPRQPASATPSASEESQKSDPVKEGFKSIREKAKKIF